MKNEGLPSRFAVKNEALQQGRILRKNSIFSDFFSVF